MNNSLKYANYYFVLAGIFSLVTMVLFLLVQFEIGSNYNIYDHPLELGNADTLAGFYMAYGVVIPLLTGVVLHSFSSRVERIPNPLRILIPCLFWLITLGLVLILLFAVFYNADILGKGGKSVLISVSAIVLLGLMITTFIIAISMVGIVLGRGVRQVMDVSLVVWSLLLGSVVAMYVLRIEVQYIYMQTALSGFDNVMHSRMFIPWYSATPVKLAFIVILFSIIIDFGKLHLKAKSKSSEYSHKFVVILLLAGVLFFWDWRIRELGSSLSHTGDLLIRSTDWVLSLSLLAYIYFSCFYYAWYLFKKFGFRVRKYPASNAYFLAGLLLILLSTALISFSKAAYTFTVQSGFSVMIIALPFILLTSYFYWGPSWLNSAGWQFKGRLHAGISLLLTLIYVFLSVFTNYSQVMAIVMIIFWIVTGITLALTYLKYRNWAQDHQGSLQNS